MCLPSGDKAAKRAAEEQRVREAQRRENITQGTAAIDTSLAPFDDAYFASQQDAYSKNAMPQLDDKYGTAYKDLIYALSGKNLLQSSVGANKLAELQKQRGDYERQIGSEAQNFANEGRKGVENTRSNLISQLNATEDPSQITAAAAREAQLLNAPPTFDTMGNFIFNAADSLETANQATGGRGLANSLTSNIRTSSGKGSSKTTAVT